MIPVNFPLNLEDFFVLHNVNINERNNTQIPAELVEKAKNIVINHVNEQQKEGFVTCARAHDIQTTIADAVGSAIEISIFDSVKNYLDTKIRNASIQYYDIALNLNVEVEGQNFELDIVCVVDTKLLVIECKADSFYGNPEAENKAIAQIAGLRSFGRLEGDFCKAIVVSQTNHAALTNPAYSQVNIIPWGKEKLMYVNEPTNFSSQLDNDLRAWF